VYGGAWQGYAQAQNNPELQRWLLGRKRGPAQKLTEQKIEQKRQAEKTQTLAVGQETQDHTRA